MEKAMAAPVRVADKFLTLEQQVFRFEKWVCIASLVAMLVAVLISVMIRYFNLHFPDTGEIAIFAMAPLTFVGAAMCTFTHTHIAVDIIKHVKNPLIQKAGRIIVALSMVVFGAVYFYTGWEFFSTALSSGEKGLDLGTPVAIPAFFLPLGMALVVLHAVAEMVRSIANIPPACEEFV